MTDHAKMRYATDDGGYADYCAQCEGEARFEMDNERRALAAREYDPEAIAEIERQDPC